jgi:hypothetical protein
MTLHAPSEIWQIAVPETPVTSAPANLMVCFQ